jgi:hypothetical protein
LYPPLVVADILMRVSAKKWLAETRGIFSLSQSPNPDSLKQVLSLLTTSLIVLLTERSVRTLDENFN